MSTYNYTISPIAVDKLDRTIRESAIATALDYVSASGTNVSIVFKSTISESDETLLDAIVAAHDGIPLPSSYVQTVKIDTLPESQPFAEPTYRTKRSATASLVTIAPNSNNVVDFLMPAERYVTGGALIVKNAQMGDYIKASVYDGYNGGIIPEPYRAALCEAWPVVAEYIEKEWVKVSNGSYSFHEINTHPLNAKITAGLMLRVQYFATSEGTDRTVAINYNLTKKL